MARVLIRHRIDGDAGGGRGAHAGRRVLEGDGLVAGDPQAIQGEQVAVRRGFGEGHVVAGDDDVEAPTQVAGPEALLAQPPQRHFDLRPNAGGDDAALDAPSCRLLEDLPEAREGRDVFGLEQMAVDAAALHHQRLQRLGEPVLLLEQADVVDLVVADELRHHRLREIHAELPHEGAEGAEVNRLGVDDQSVQVEEHGTDHW